MTTAMKLADIATMPGFRPEALTTEIAVEQTRSVSRGAIYFGLPASGGGIPTKNDAGKIWRCPACNEGGFQS